MLMHSCYCVFISVTGGFVQMLEDLKNLLKLSLKILFIKRKKENFLPFPPFLRFGPLVFLLSAGPVPSCGPAPQPAAQLAFPPPLGPATRPAQQPRASASPAPGNYRAQLLTPGPHLSAPPPTSRVQRPLPVKAEPPPRRASWERPRAPRPR